MPLHIFNSRGPIVVGVTVEAGVVKEGTPVTIPSQEVSIPVRHIENGTKQRLTHNHVFERH